MLTLDQFKSRFRYKRDKGETWTFLDPDDDGFYCGDCEDFALTTALILAGGSHLRLLWDTLTFKSVVWYCTTRRGGGHAMLWYRGKGWIDNIYPDWRSKPIHNLKLPLWCPFMYLKIAISRILP